MIRCRTTFDGTVVGDFALLVLAGASCCLRIRVRCRVT